MAVQSRILCTATNKGYLTSFKKTTNPNVSPIGKRFGFECFGAGDRTRTGTLSPAVDFESTTSTIPSHRQVCNTIWIIDRCRQSFIRWPPCRRRDVAIVCGARRMSSAERLRPSPTAALAVPSLHPPLAALGLATVDFESTTSTIPSHRRGASIV